MLRSISPWRHVLVGLAIAVMALLAGFGILGGGDESLLRPEHFDAKQVTIWPEGDDGVRLREVVDIDFGPTPRHGYQRIVPHDFGAPVDVSASSPDADDSLDVAVIGDETRIRVGDPVTTVTGRHRYVVEYTLPDAQVSSGELAIDVIGTDETFETERFEVVLTGFDIDGPECHTGGTGDFGGCTFERTPSGDLVAVIEPLPPGDGITVDGRISGLVAPQLPDPPPQPQPVPTGFRPLGLVMIPLGIVAAGLVFVLGRRYGSNEVAGAGAAEAAFGDLPLPGAGARPADVATYRVPDSRLAEMATIEFAPPRGLEPWQGAALLRETVDDDTVAAWFSEMIALDALTIEQTGDDDETVRLRRGEGTLRLSAVDQGHITRLFGGGDIVELGSYDAEFTKVWSAIAADQRRFVRSAGWWSRGGPAGGAVAAWIVGLLVVGVGAFLGALFIAAVITSQAVWRIVTAPWVAVVAGFVVPFLVAVVVYAPMFAARTATGSALALRTESFRRFLAGSEGRHVEWAWERGLLREYSAWAVALGAAGAWSEAIRASNVPEPAVALSGPLILHTQSSAFRSTHVAPSSSSGGGGGGGVGGGGGGGSSGSW